jgi:heme/copper-type cytochrome/quinol oxidase subunit 4
MNPPQTAAAHASTPGRSFERMSARRLLVFGGILAVLIGMIFGDVFAVFILHPNADRIGQHLLAATEAVSAGQPQTALAQFSSIGRLLENRGTKVDTHVHAVAFGFLALLLALVQPYVALPKRRRKQLAKVFLLGSALLPVCVFLIYYVGLAYSPLRAIGWASILADFGGLLVIIATFGYLWGIWRHFRTNTAPPEDELLRSAEWSGRALRAGGTLLMLAGFLHGAYYAWAHLYEHEARETSLLATMVDRATTNDMPAAQDAVKAYSALSGEKAIAIAAHSHVIEFGLLALLLSFIQPFVFLSEPWKRRWVWTLLAGSVILPVAVQAEMRWGLFAGGIADVGGLLVILALCGMLTGVVRYTGKLDATTGGTA